jgi:phage tail sheath protein FI
MARSINSPGVQIIETDLSQYQQFGGPTTVFVPGFASQGPTDEVVLVSTASELETVYGIPETPAERYFHYTCKEILNSPATLLTTRLPYGSGAGDDFDSQYSALLYPVASGINGFIVGTPTHINLSEVEYDKIIQNNVTWSSVASSLSSATPTGASFNGTSLNAGIVVLNTAQTTVNEYYEGYYVALTDNTEIGVDTDFGAVNTLNSLTGLNSFYNVPSTRLGFALSGTVATLGTNSVSEVIERVPTYDFGQNFYQDSLILTVFKIRNSVYEPQTLIFNLQESFIGSLDNNRKTVEGQTFYLQNLVNNRSSEIKVLINPNISSKTDWSPTGATNDPGKTVRIGSNARSLYPVGIYKPTYTYEETKNIGNVISKVERALTRIETTETVLVDLVVDGGLTTISATTSADNFDDTLYVLPSELKLETSNINQRWRSAFNIFSNFVSNTRKDCMFIADPLRNIFVNGENVKTLSVRGNTFSTDVYVPLKNLVNTVNTNYAAIYGNWVKTYDKYSDNFVWIPASGYVAAIYARTDTTAQPWIAPAGLNRGLIQNIVDLGFNPNQKQRDALYTISINPIVLFSGDGFVVFGQKTLQNKPSAFDRVNVRRLFLSLERATQQSLKYFVFEPNTEFTRTRLKNTITPIFDLAKNTEGLYDYLIVCDERNNTPDVIDRNELAVDIYIKPVKAAEFILVNFIATRTGQNFQELI